MEKLRYIICLLAGFIWTSCTKAPVFQESLVPEIVSITSIPEIHSAVLMSDLNAAPFGKVECGFYFGTDKTNLKRLSATLVGKSFVLSLNDLDEGTTYYFKAFISNGVNEIGSGFESFLTDVEPVVPEQPSDPAGPSDPQNPDNPSNPENPSDPENPKDPEPEDPAPENPEDPADPSDPENPENPSPEDPDNPTEPEDPEPDNPEPENPAPENPAPENPEPEDPEPEDPEPEDPEQPAEFDVEITELKAEINDYIAELTAVLDGDASLVTECWFMVGYSPDKLSKIKGTIEGTSVKAYLAGLESGTYYYKAVITNGTETKETEVRTFSF